jgi:Family of unknown function (DUF6328)
MVVKGQGFPRWPGYARRARVASQSRDQEVRWELRAFRIRDETEAERADRNLAELLQELRVAGLGVQVLFGFLLSLPFTNRFTKLSHGQRDLYLATPVLAAVATALLWRVTRWRVRRHRRTPRRSGDPPPGRPPP